MIDRMRIFIAIMFILLVGLFFVSGCTSTSETETKESGTGSQAPEQQNQKEAESGRLPKPPEFP